MCIPYTNVHANILSLTSLVPRPSLTAFFAAVENIVGLPQLRKKAVREGLGTRLASNGLSSYEAGDEHVREEGDDDGRPVPAFPAVKPQHPPADVQDDQNVGCES